MNTIRLGLFFVLAGSWASAQESYAPYGPRPFYPRAYAGVSFGQLRYSEEGLDTITPATAMVFVGAPLTPNLAIEGRIGGGLGSAQTNSYGIDVRSVFAGYFKGSVPLASGFSLYGLAGAANVDLRRDFGLVYANDTGFSYGLGMEFDLASNARLGLEWTHLVTGDNLGYSYDVNEASISMAWRF